MGIDIKRLTPELSEDYLYFFDNTPHSTNKPEHRCYCVCWSSKDCEGTDFSSAVKRRDIAKEYVRDGHIQGYLAYVDNKVIGWCNANTKEDCYGCVSWKMFMKPVKEDQSDIKIKSVLCFAVSPEMRGQGVATQLLKRVCEDAKEDGFDLILNFYATMLPSTKD